MKITLGEFGTIIYNEKSDQVIGIKKPTPEKKSCKCGCGETFRPYPQGQDFKSAQHFHTYREGLRQQG